MAQKKMHAPPYQLLQQPSGACACIRYRGAPAVTTSIVVKEGLGWIVDIDEDKGPPPATKKEDWFFTSPLF